MKIKNHKILVKALHWLSLFIVHSVLYIQYCIVTL